MTISCDHILFHIVVRSFPTLWVIWFRLMGVMETSQNAVYGNDTKRTFALWGLWKIVWKPYGGYGNFTKRLFYDYVCYGKFCVICFRLMGVTETSQNAVFGSWGLWKMVKMIFTSYGVYGSFAKRGVLFIGVIENCLNACFVISGLWKLHKNVVFGLCGLWKIF